MSLAKLNQLSSVIVERREELLANWRRQVRLLSGAESLDTPTINDQVPELLDSLASALSRSADASGPQTDAISSEHGLLRWQAGFDVTEVVAEYSILRNCVQELAENSGLSLSGKALKIINDVVDEAVGKAVKSFETMMTIELGHHHDEHIGFIVHDLRTPLEALSLATTVLEKSLDADCRGSIVNHALTVQRGNITRISDRVRQVLKRERGLGKAFQPEYTFINLRAQVRELIRDFAPLAAAADTQIINNVPEDIQIYSDGHLLTQIIQNLLSNSLKFTEHGDILIGARKLSEGTVECWIKDSGTGIDPDRIEKIFERFETDDDPENRGIGLGLAIVKEIVELLNGEIRVQSQPGAGSTFAFLIPGRKSN